MTGGTGADSFVLETADRPAGVTTITDLSASDSLIVEWTGTTPPVITITSDTANNQSSILIDGVLSAQVQGTSTLTADRVILTRLP